MGLLLFLPSISRASVSNISLQNVTDSQASLEKQSTSQIAYESFMAATETLYNAVNKGDLQAVIDEVADIEQQFRHLPMTGIATADGIQALAHSITEMKRATAAVQPDESRWKSGAAALRLAADALVHPEKPIWHQYRTILQEDIKKISTSIPQNATASGPVPESVHLAFNQLSEHYRVIRTAVLLKSEPWIVERSDSVMRYASRVYLADSPTGQLLSGTIAPLLEAMEGLFPGNKAASSAVVPPVAVAPPSWGWSAMMGSFIVTVLTWVGWRRYRIDEYSPTRRKLPPTNNDSEDAAQQWLKKWRNKR